MVFISVTVLSFSAILFYINQVDMMKKDVVKNSVTQASLIGASIESAIIFNDERSANKTLKVLEINPVVEFAVVVLPDGKKFSYYSRNKEIDILRLDIDVSRKRYISNDYLDIIHEIIDRDIVIGYIFIRSNLIELKNKITHYKEMLVFIILFSIILAFFLSHFLKKIITMPLDAMVNYVKELSETKDYGKRLNLDLRDELGTLVEGFNYMLDVVQDREKELEKHSDYLQEVVNQRTEQLYEKAHFDSLTKLPNRALLLERLNHALLAAKRKKSRLAILFIDLDRFKVINDSIGHDVGDQLLIAVAERLQKTSRDIDTIARLGGDEFVYLLEDISHPEDPARIAERINILFSKPFHLEKHVLYATASIGISLYPNDGSESGVLMKNADISMYCAKKNGPGNYKFYKEDMNSSSFTRLKLENKLRSAAENNEFYLVYQPQVTVENNEINSVEALLRWHNPELGDITPNVFIPIAEEIGIINQVGMWVVTETCRQIDSWAEHGIDDMVVAINISASHLLSVDLINHIRNEVVRFNVEYDRLELEITEEVFLEHSERTLDVLNELQSLGIQIAIDDFGTGYSSLQYLKDLPVDVLKLDGMFIMDLENNLSSQGIVSSTIILAHSLNMRLVAECVETSEQFEFLKQKNCDLIQGYYFYKPVSPEKIIEIKSIDKSE